MNWAIIRIWTAMATFAFYNAVSIKGLTNTWYWHIAQFVTVGLFIWPTLASILKELFGYWRERNFNRFGAIGWRFALVAAIASGIYVELLHILLPIVQGWK